MDNFRLGLTNEYSEMTNFIIQPCFEYQKENEGFILNGDMIYIISGFDRSNFIYQPYLHASKEKPGQFFFYIIRNIFSFMILNKNI